MLCGEGRLYIVDLLGLHYEHMMYHVMMGVATSPHTSHSKKLSCPTFYESTFLLLPHSFLLQLMFPSFKIKRYM